MPNWFYEVNTLKWIGDKTQLSCIYHVNVHNEYFCSMFSTCILQLADSTCRSLHNSYMMWYLKEICSAGNISFLTGASFSNDLSVIGFWSVWPSSIGLAIIRHPADTFPLELVCAFRMWFCVPSMHASYFNRTQDRMHNPVQDCTQDHFGRSRVRPPDLAA